MVLISMYYTIHSWLVPTRAEARGKNDGHYTWPETCIMQHREASKLDSWLVPASTVSEGKKTRVFTLAEGSLEVKLPTLWTDEKQSRAEAERRERLEERRSEEKESEERRCRCAKR